MTDFKVNVLRLPEQGAAPSSLANAGKLYSKDVGGVSMRFYMSSAGVEYQLSPSVPDAGTVPYSALDNLITLGGSSSLPNDTAANPIFAAARDRVTLAATTKYRMRMHLLTSRTGAGNCSMALAFNAGSCTYTSIEYTVWSYGETAASVLANQPWVVFSQTAASTTATQVSTTHTYRTYFVEGVIDVNGSGTFVPTLKASFAPGSTTEVETGSYLELVNLGASSFTSRGGWG